ncbi:FecR family protein [Jejuia pallidilutea]|uniref:Putative anti-sigma factor n=2 Tax=Jejuia pallidilutea TaxID=504487 RepID=A0A090VN65_9FLAO|nr:FecR family protein [Jejuia pallidilutea]GAL65448.1 putative anti-sigma factor [Jejuia pallidilutea]
MMPKNIEELIIKFLNKSINKKEWDELNLWYEKSEHNKLLHDYIQINYLVDEFMKEFNTERTKNNLLLKIKKDKRLSLRLNLMKYAAVVILFISTAYFFIGRHAQNNPQEVTPIIVDTNIKHGTDKAVLTLEDGSEVELAKGEEFKTKDVNSNGEAIIYDSNNKNKTKLAYNYLTIPRGGQFRVLLSDGTQVWLNSETQLKYPKNFIKGQTREVELIYGEAYFDISPSSNHNGDMFKVVNASQHIEVLGTEFNIKAYKDEDVVYTTLVEGKVTVNSEKKYQILKPSEQSILDIKTNNIDVKLVDAYNEISWKEGIFTFEKMPLIDIVKVLSRWYDIDFVFESEAIKENKFNGSLKRNLKIEEILDAIKNFNKIKDYKIYDRTIIIK